MNEIDRQLLSHRFRLNSLKWLGAPVMVLIVAYLAYFLYERGVGPTESVLAGLGGLASSLVAGFSGYRTLQRHIRELEEERAELQAFQTGAGGRE